MKIGIIGTGNIGSALARHFVSRGHSVSIANSRGPSSLAEIAAKTGAKAVTAEEAAGAQDIVVITVPQAAVPNLPIDVLSKSKAVVIDTGNYYPARDGLIVEIEGGVPDSVWVSNVIGHRVVKAFNNIVAASLVAETAAAGAEERIALSVAGDDIDERRRVIQLVDQIGFDGIDAGDLSDSWRQHPGTPAYCRNLDVEALKSALAEADLSKVSTYRAEADEGMKAYLKNHG